MASLYDFLDLIFLFAFLCAPFTLVGYYSLLAIQAFMTLRPISGQKASALTCFAFQCLIPLIGFPIFWICYYWWHPYPNPSEWGSDRNGFIAFYTTVSLAIALAVLTTILSSKPRFTGVTRDK